MFNTIRQTQELLSAGGSETMLVAQFFVYDRVEGGKFGTGASKGAYYCSDATSTDECHQVVNEVATWQYPKSEAS
eukprot:CAMPEP_0206229820 /NCGR_PEP_ID=MMETSP0047_2-20121206/9906_1 /ASSEMBLY_ACC=CAM_ASM_000192 /TAXON_ID=195065 /ORGANISM="Chroomonas mesostigmatica_cf, Strain CCMP1168" /LENGTH=74 /DNA_ID=CAMNT_0053653155 /DNA_START=42 /DNA_END=266 /DNA_ORIENTATION=+